MSWFERTPVDADILRDAQRMARVAAGDERVWRELMDQELKRAVTLARRMMNHDAEAEEVALEACTRLWRQAPSWQPRARISTWLHRVVHNLCLDRLRQRREEVAMDDLAEELAAPESSGLFRAQVARVVEAAMSRLPERQRTALTLVYQLEMSSKEAAGVMGMGVEALDSLLARGRRGLKQSLSPYQQDLLDD